MQNPANSATENGNVLAPTHRLVTRASLAWDWDIEYVDRKREVATDTALHGSTPFNVDRRVLRDVVREKTGIDLSRITFLSAGTFHKAYLITLVDLSELVATVARRYMPRYKTESEVATMSYIRENTNIPVPKVYHYDFNPCNRLGGEYILMSKAPGIQLGTVFHSLCYQDLVKLLENLAFLLLPLFAHRFTEVGSLYTGPNPRRLLSSSAPTPKANHTPDSELSYSPAPGIVDSKLNDVQETRQDASEFHVGPIISWPFFGSNRGELSHPNELNRGPWSSSREYFSSCAEREIIGVIRENQGSAAPHRLHLDPDEIQSSRHHRMTAVPGDESDDSDEWDLEESEEEWEGPGDNMYQDYRRMQRTTFLIAHLSKREELVRQEMNRWMSLMDRIAVATLDDTPEQFGLDCHDLSLENIFVDANEPSKIVCIIDWESTTTRPLWQCAHLPAFVQSSPFIGRLFREAIVKVGHAAEAHAATLTRNGKKVDLAATAREWLFYESAGQRMRMAHRFVEWDGWEEGLIDSILGFEEQDEDWLRLDDESILTKDRISPPAHSPPNAAAGTSRNLLASALPRKKNGRLPLPLAKEQEKEQTLITTGDFCGGRGGELGRRLEAWLTKNGIEEGHSIAVRWELDHESHQVVQENEGPRLHLSCSR